jgi:hypothetical protein
MVLAYKPAIPWPGVAQFFMGTLRLSKINGKPAPSKHSPHLAAMLRAHTRISPSTCIQKRNKSVCVCFIKANIQQSATNTVFESRLRSPVHLIYSSILLFLTSNNYEIFIIHLYIQQIIYVKEKEWDYTHTHTHPWRQQKHKFKTGWLLVAASVWCAALNTRSFDFKLKRCG